MYFFGPHFQILLLDFIKLYFKGMFGLKFNYYDKKLIEIFDEYSYYLNFKKFWKKKR